MSQLSFIKMHGLGNDFVVLDARKQVLELTPEKVRVIADRRLGVGCDQLIVIEPPGDLTASVFMRIYNADGGEVSACGNASRCVALLIMQETNSREVVIETAAGLLHASATKDDAMVCVDMGKAALDWQDIPLAMETDTMHLKIEAGPFNDPVAVSMGNPHVVFFVDNALTAPLETFAPGIEHDKMFPQFTNVGAAEIISPDKIRLRVWERGTGMTRACGTGACAALVAANRRGLSARAAEVIVDGGRLHVEWRTDGHVLLSGPAAFSFTGSL